MCWGEPRLTQDADLTVLAPYGDEAPVVDLLLDHFTARRSDARQFALTRRVLLLQAREVPVDVSLAALPFEQEALSRSVLVTWTPDLSFRVCSAEDLTVYKLVAGRPRDLVDIEGVVRAQRPHLDIARIRTRTAELAELIERGDLVAPFERILRQADRSE